VIYEKAKYAGLRRRGCNLPHNGWNKMPGAERHKSQRSAPFAGEKSLVDSNKTCKSED
jgi:hypothetical protein